MNIGFIGSGQMAQALAAGIAKSTSVQFVVSDPSDASKNAFRNLITPLNCQVEEVESNSEVVSKADFVFIAVKPQYLASALKGFGSEMFSDQHCLISIVAGVSLVRLQELSGCKRIVRVMPNTPCLIGKGVSAATANDSVSKGQLEQILEWLGCVGTICQVTEGQLDAVTGVSGSGPAYVYNFIESLSDAGVLNGLPRDVAQLLAVETVLGAAAMVKESGEHTAILRERVTSPGGTTIAALKSLEENGLRNAVMSAVSAAAKRSQELGKA